MAAIETPHGWTYLPEQVNGDEVDCLACGNPINDDFPLGQDQDGAVYHVDCLLSLGVIYDLNL